MKEHIALHEKALALLDLLVRAMKCLEDYKEAVNRWDNASDWDTIRLVNTRLALSNRVGTYVRVVARIRGAYIAQSQKIWLQVFQAFPVESAFTAWGELEALEKQQAPASTVTSNEYGSAELAFAKYLTYQNPPRKYSYFSNTEHGNVQIYDPSKPLPWEEIKQTFLKQMHHKPADEILREFGHNPIPIFHDHIEGEPCAPWSTNIHSSHNTQSNDNNKQTDAAGTPAS